MLSKEILRIIPQSVRAIRRLSGAQLDGSTTIHHMRLMFLVQEGKGQSQIADILQISLPAVSKMINGLEEKGLVNRSAGEDKRCVRLKLTAKGTKTLDTISRSVEKDLNRALSRLTPEERRSLGDGLLAMEKTVQFLNEEQ